MPRFAANLTMLFTEVPFLDRFARARQAGKRSTPPCRSGTRRFA